MDRRRSGGQLGGLEVDRWVIRLDVMLKAPEGLLGRRSGDRRHDPAGDGRVLIVLDLGEIFREARH
jgi:chemotaxis protein histidine kinase CheA